MVQELGLHTPSARGLGSIHGQRTRSPMPKLRVHMPQLKIHKQQPRSHICHTKLPRAATKNRCSHTHTYTHKEKAGDSLQHEFSGK